MFNTTDKKVNNNIKRLWLNNLLLLRKNSEAGQAFVISLMLGLIALGGATIALMNASDNKNNVIANQGAIRAQNITDAGIQKSLSTFSQGNNNYLLLASYNGNNWISPNLDYNNNGDSTDDIDINNANGCEEVNGVVQLNTNPNPQDFIDNLVANNTLISDIESSGIGSGLNAGTYSVKDYQYDRNNGQGILTIQGQTSTNTQNKAQYQVTFAVNVPATNSNLNNLGAAAALIGKDINTKGMAIFADTVICTDSVTTGSCGNDVTISPSYCADGTIFVDTSKNYSSLTSDELAEYNLLETMMGSTNNGLRAPDNRKVSDIIISDDVSIPPIPVAPTGTNILSVDVATGITNVLSSGAITTINATNQGLFIDLTNALFASSFVEETVNGETYHAIYIQLNNMAGRTGDINVIINEPVLEALTVNGKNIDTEKMIVRLYVAEDMTLNGNAAIQVYDASLSRIAGATEKERNQISSLRVLGGNANGTPVGNLTWDMNGTGCLMAHVHGPTVSLSLPQGNGCGNSGGQRPLELNSVAANHYGNDNYNSIGNSISTPNGFGAMWARNITNGSSGSSASFYENKALTKRLAYEFGATYPGITPSGARSSSVEMESNITALVRQKAQ